MSLCLNKVSLDLGKVPVDLGKVSLGLFKLFLGVNKVSLFLNKVSLDLSKVSLGLDKVFLKRAAYQAGHIWGQALVPMQNIPSPASWGWIKSQVGWTPLWTTLQRHLKYVRN